MIYTEKFGNIQINDEYNIMGHLPLKRTAAKRISYLWDAIAPDLMPFKIVNQIWFLIKSGAAICILKKDNILYFYRSYEITDLIESLEIVSENYYGKTEEFENYIQTVDRVLKAESNKLKKYRKTLNTYKKGI